MAGGLVMAGVSLVAAQRPVYSNFVTQLDYNMARAYWDRLEPGALVFDANPNRAPSLLARFTNSSYTWYQAKPEWTALREAPDPAALSAAGYRYLYLDNRYWDSLPEQVQNAVSDCGEVIEEFSDNEGNFRRLVDLKNCR
jgi:hypothetical protein